MTLVLFKSVISNISAGRRKMQLASTMNIIRPSMGLISPMWKEPISSVSGTDLILITESFHLERWIKFHPLWYVNSHRKFFGVPDVDFMGSFQLLVYLNFTRDLDRVDSIFFAGWPIWRFCSTLDPSCSRGSVRCWTWSKCPCMCRVQNIQLPYSVRKTNRLGRSVHLLRRRFYGQSWGDELETWQQIFFPILWLYKPGEC